MITIDPAREEQHWDQAFIISKDGIVVTNNHVIENADEIKIEMLDGSMLSAEVIGTDPKTDIAILKIDTSEELPFVKFGNSDVLRAGDWVVAIGNPFGQGFSVSAGIVSARGGSLTVDTMIIFKPMLQLTVEIRVVHCLM